MGVPPDPDGGTYWEYPAGHPARRFTATGLRDLMIEWMEQEPKRCPPLAAQPNGGPQAPLSADILRAVAHHPGADCLLPLLARLTGRPVALVVRADRRYRSPDPTVRVYRPGTHDWLPAVERHGRIVQLGGEGGSPAPPVHCPRTILVVTRMGATYTALGPRAHPTQYTDPAWVREVLGQAEHEQGGTHEREAQAGGRHPNLLALAGHGRQAQEASDATRRLADQAHLAEGRSSDDDPGRNHPRQEPEEGAGVTDDRPDPGPAARGVPQRERRGHPEPLDRPQGNRGMELDEEGGEPRAQARVRGLDDDSPGSRQEQQVDRRVGTAVPDGSQDRREGPLRPAPRPPTPEPREDIAHSQRCPFLGNRDPLQEQQEAEQQNQCREHLEAELQADLAGVEEYQDEQEDIILDMCRLDRRDRGGRYNEYWLWEQRSTNGRLTGRPVGTRTVRVQQQQQRRRQQRRQQQRQQQESSRTRPGITTRWKRTPQPARLGDKRARAL